MAVVGSLTTQDDAAIIEEYGGITNVPAYLMEMKPVLRVEGEAIAIGNPVILGETQQFVMEFIAPSGGVDRVSNDVTVGAYYAVGLDLGKMPQRLVEERKAKLTTWKNLLGVEDVPLDSVVGELLYVTALTYFMEQDVLNEISARLHGVVFFRHPSEAVVSTTSSVGYLFWSPYSFDISGVNIDVDRNIYSAFSTAGDSGKPRDFMLSSGILGSSLEHAIFEQLFNVQAVSAIKLLQVANEQGVKIYHINSTNLAEVLPALQLSQEVKIAVQNAVNTGKIVVIPERNIQYYNWTGVGYIVLDPETGAGAYMISGGKAGGDIAVSIECDPVTQTVRLLIKIAGYTIGVPLLQTGAWIKTQNVKGLLSSILTGLGYFLVGLSAIFEFMYYLYLLGEEDLAWISLMLSVIQILALGMIFISPLGFVAMFILAFFVLLITNVISSWIMKKATQKAGRKVVCP